MSFPRYPKYKACGIEWLGDVPAGWTVRPLKTIASGKGALFIDGDWIESKDISNAGIRYLTSGNVGEGSYKEQGQGFITDETFNELKCTEVLPGDLLISRLNLPIGRACIVPDLGSRIVTCVDNVVVRPASSFNRQFCVYLLSCKGHLENTEILGRGATMPRISRSALGRLPFAFPPLLEQTAITEFLDRETGKIDELVAEQRRLMELLKEKRQAVISHAVTKGLNPHAPMKPSGIEWLGEVPEHWKAKPIRRVISEPISNGIFKKKGEFGSGVLLINVFDIYRPDFKIDYISLDRVICDDSEVSSYKVESGDLFFVRSSLKQEGIAVVAMADPCAEPVVYECHLIRARPNRKILNSRFGSYILNSHVYCSAMIARAKMMTMTTIGQEAILSTVLPIPPLSEQEAIVAFLDTELAKFDTLTAEAQRAIDLLQERRTALISAAVTGQIDVRTKVASVPENE
jgi:type I restriction enzyme S subunit